MVGEISPEFIFTRLYEDRKSQIDANDNISATFLFPMYVT